MRRREADALDAVDRVERAQQVGELRAVLPGAEVAAVGVDVLAEQRDLDARRRGELLDLVHDVAHAPADLAAAHRRHDAERARVVAADLDRDPRRVRRRRAGPAAPTGTPRAPRGSRRSGPRRGPARAAPGACARLWVPNTTSTWRRPLAHELAVLLGEAAADRDLQVGPRVLQRLQSAEVAVELVVGVLADAARVEHDDVGGVEVVGRLHAVGREQPGDPLGVVLVHLAPVGAHEEAAGHGRPVYERPCGADSA